MRPQGLVTKGRADVLTVGFGATVAMWAAGYLLRLPGSAVPSWALGVVLLVCLLGAGVAAGRWTAGGWRSGAAAGLLSSALNLLILGSLLGGDRPNEVAPSALWWIPGSLLAGALLGAVGGRVGRRTAGPSGGEIAWTAWFARVAAVATFFLLMVGGLVTSNKAGLAVVDWPNSFGYNMFLYPLSRMTGGIYYEHAHRLFGSLVGLTTLVLTIHLLRVEKRRWVRWLAVSSLAAVVVQGILGGLRVTGRFTLSTSAEAVAPNLTLAVVHGVLGQLVFALLVALAVVTVPSWRAASPDLAPASGSFRGVTVGLVGVLMVQLVLGALQRHLARGLLVHVSLAVVVVVLATWAGVRALAESSRAPVTRSGRALLTLVLVQVALGLTAYAAVGFRAPDAAPELWQVIVATAHQATGAALLATAVILALWARRVPAVGRVTG
jgi:cytochrome c oxidase assembly protein subunit 15